MTGRGFTSDRPIVRTIGTHVLDAGRPKATTSGPSTDVIDVSLFGNLSVEYGSSRAVNPLPPSTIGLTAYLLLHAERQHGREELIERFWPGLAPDSGRRRLSQTLWRIARRFAAIGISDLFDNTPAAVRISPRYEVRTDVADFERLLDGTGSPGERTSSELPRCEILSEALALYVGEFLETNFEQWTISERHRLHHRYRSALFEHTRLLKASSQFDRALRAARLLVATDPLDEAACREAMTVAFLAKRPHEARELHAACVRQLDTELGAKPDRSTDELLQHINGSSMTPPMSPPPLERAPRSSDGAASALFLARERECERFFELVDSLTAGGGGTLLIEGDAGIGKTRFIAECAAGARWRGATVLHGTHRGTNGPAPFRGLIEALAPTLEGLRSEQLAEVVGADWFTSLSEFFDVDPGTDSKASGPSRISTETRWQRCEALAQWILAQGALGPTVVVLDDVHWMDPDSIEVLAQLDRRLATSSVLLVLSYRHREARANRRLWDRLRRIESVHAHRIRLPELSTSDASRLAAWAVGGRETAESTEEVVCRTGGNPLFVIETMRAIGERPVGAIHKLPVATTVTEAVLGRLENLGSPVVEMLGVLAVANTAMTTAQLVAVTSWARGDVIAALAAAQDAGLIAETTTGQAFEHEVVRRAVHLAVPPAQRRALHRRIAGVLELSGHPVEELAEHAARAGWWARAFDHYVAAAERAVALGAFKTASEHFVRARRAHGRAGLGKTSLRSALLAHEQILDVLSERRRQRDVLDALQSISSDDLTTIEVLRRKATLAAGTGDAESAVSLATAAVERARLADELRAESAMALGVALISAGAATDAIRPLREAVALARTTTVAIEAGNALGRALILLQDFDASERTLDAALRSSIEAADGRGEVDALGALGVLAIEMGDHVRAADRLSTAVDKAHTLGYRRGAAVNLVNLASMFAMTGRSGASLAPYGEALAAFQTVRDRRGVAMVLANRAVIRLRLGDDLDSIATDVRRAARYFIEIGDDRHRAMCLDTLANIDRQSKRTASARRNLRRALELARRSSDEWFAAQILRSTALLELAAGRLRIALEAVQQGREIANGREFVGLLPSLFVVESAILRGLGENEGAMDMACRAARDLTDHSDLAASVARWAAETLEADGDDPARIADLARHAHRLMTRELEGLDDDARDRALRSAPEHTRVADLLDRVVPRTETHQLRVANRGFRSGDHVETLAVELTLAHPDDQRLRSKAEQRRARLLRLHTEAADRGTELRPRELAELLGVSLATVKRDLQALRVVERTDEQPTGAELLPLRRVSV